MSKLWRKKDEWYQYAPCDGSVDHTLPPSRDDELRWPDEKPLPVADVGALAAICDGCPVRVECIRANVVEAREHSVWVAGVWLPTPTANKNKAKANAELDVVRAALIDSLPFEEALRPDDIL